MSLTLTLESFDDESVAAQKSHPEFTRGFEEGIAAGRQEAELAQGNLSAALVGNTAEHVIDSLDCDVLALKPDGYVSPLAKD